MDYRLGALVEKFLENVSEKDVFQKPWNEVALPKWEFEK
jgi:hypothetical protein